LFNNNVNSSYAVEIDKGYVEEILSHKEKFNISFEFLNEDCFKLDLSKIKNKINVYLFDANHDYKDHYKALEYYYPVLDDEFIFIVDDWLDEGDPYYSSWKQVVEGTRDAIKDLDLKILFEEHKKKIIPSSENWWGGYWMSVLKK
jgi:hypothetical protein